MADKKPESVLWGHLRKQLLRAAPSAHLVRVENMTCDGHPDVDLCVGGVATSMELKRVSYWPKRAATVVRLPHYTEGQRGWLKKRILAGGRVAVLLGVDREDVSEYLLFTGASVLAVGCVSRADLYALAAGHWHGGIDGAEFVRVLAQARRTVGRVIGR